MATLFEKITESKEVLAEYLSNMPVIPLVLTMGI